MDDAYKNELIKSMISCEFNPEIIEREKVNLSLFDSLPISDLSVLGPAFLPMIESIQGITAQLLGTTQSSTEVLYRATLPEGATKMFSANDGSGFIGGARGTKGIGQTRFTPVEITNGTINNKNSVPLKINPYMITIAAMLISINMKLNDIKRSQDSLMEFLEQKEKAKLEGSLSFLTDILNDYKLNWNNEEYKTVNHIKVLDIKQEAEQSIKLFKKQTESFLDDGALFHTTKKLNKNINDLLIRFDDYRLAVYIYAFSSYVDVLLLENFDTLFLKKVTDRISNYALEYRETYTDVYTALEIYIKKSARSIASRGAAGVTKFLGKTVEKIPKISDTQIDETLIETSKKIKEFEMNTHQKISRMIVGSQKVDITPFVNNIQEISFLYNEPLTILISEDAIYIENKH